MAECPSYVPLCVSGSPYERGRTHGEARKGLIRSVISLWKSELEKEYDLPADEVIARFVKRTDFLSAIKRWTPDLLDEIHGIADGCGLDFETVFSFQCVDEIWANSARIVGEHCTTFGFRGDSTHPPLLAQTVDVEAFRDGYQLVLEIVDESTGGKSLVTTCAGIIGFNGLNAWGVGVCCNAELQLRHAFEGLPVACVMRGILQQPSVDEALAFLYQVPHATGQHYLVGNRTQIRSIECSSSVVAEFAPTDVDNVVWHTNHPLKNDDVHPWYREMLEAGQSYTFLDNSRARLAALEARLRSELRGSRFEQFTEILSSRDDTRHPICSSREADTFYAEVGLFTFASTVMVLSDAPELHVTFGPPTQAPRHVLRFEH
jgi:isopenicillin-N N-acyltransferase-like protein